MEVIPKKPLVHDTWRVWTKDFQNFKEFCCQSLDKTEDHLVIHDFFSIFECGKFGVVYIRIAKSQICFDFLGCNRI